MARPRRRTLSRLTAAYILAVPAAAMTTQRVIDSHLHVWANADEAAGGFPYAQAPPEALQNEGSIDSLLRRMRESAVDGALIVQPINHEFDHSYVMHAIQRHPDRFKGMLLFDPRADAATALHRLEELCLKGFVGVRFNPYLWPSTGEQKWERMSEGSGLAVYQRCGELRMPVGIMCFQGLKLHYDDIRQLMDRSPSTICVLDHFGFTTLADPESFQLLLSLAEYPQVYIKVSALFRLGDSHPYDRVREERFRPLLQAFGSERLLFGSDFPYVLEQPAGYKVHQLVASWIRDEQDRQNIMSGTAERLFGGWSKAK